MRKEENRMFKRKIYSKMQEWKEKLACTQWTMRNFYGQLEIQQHFHY